MTTLQMAIRDLIEHAAKVRGDTHGVLCATILMELWHQAAGRDNCDEIMNTAIEHTYRELKEYEAHRNQIIGAIRKEIDSVQFETYGTDVRDVALGKIESFLNALESEDQGG